MQQLFLIRHGLTEWNARGKFQGHSDIALSEAGRAQAQALRVRLAELERNGPRLDWVVSSPLKRALQTAELALPEREIHLDERLKELNFGAFEGHTLAQNRATEAWNAWYDDPFKQSTPGGESYEQLRLRAVDWLESLPTGNSVAFTHSGTIQMLISHILGVEHPKWRKRVILRPTSVTCIICHSGERVIERVNDAYHLESSLENPFREERRSKLEST